MTDPDRLQTDNRRLRAENAGLREELDNVKARLGYALHQAVELRKRIPSTMTQAAAPGGTRPRATDPLERARYADAALRRLRDMFASTPGSPEDSAVIDLDEQRRIRAERAR